MRLGSYITNFTLNEIGESKFNQFVKFCDFTEIKLPIWILSWYKNSEGSRALTNVKLVLESHNSFKLHFNNATNVTNEITSEDIDNLIILVQTE